MVRPVAGPDFRVDSLPGTANKFQHVGYLGMLQNVPVRHEARVPSSPGTGHTYTGPGVPARLGQGCTRVLRSGCARMWGV